MARAAEAGRGRGWVGKHAAGQRAVVGADAGGNGGVGGVDGDGVGGGARVFVVRHHLREGEGLSACRGDGRADVA